MLSLGPHELEYLSSRVQATSCIAYSWECVCVIRYQVDAASPTAGAQPAVKVLEEGKAALGSPLQNLPPSSWTS